jgi:hypothetical protein
MQREVSRTRAWRAWRASRVVSTLCALLAGAPVAGSPVARAQDPPAARPLANASRDLEATEGRLYEAARRAPRDPGARAALGAWLASRGQLKSGAVLLEEARLFGGNAPLIAARLAPVYLWLRDWASLAALPATPLSEGEQARAKVLAARESSTVGADSTTVSFAPLEIGALGRVPFVVGYDTLWGEVDPQETGIVLPGLGRGAGLVEILATDARGALGVIRSVGLGGITLRDVPVRVDAALGVGRARLGFDVFAALAPTVDARAGAVTLRGGGSAVAREGAEGIPFLLGFPGVRLALRSGEAPLAITSPAARAALRGRPWTVDLRRGVIWVDPPR